MNFKRVGIIGTNTLSVSMALKMKAQRQPVEIVGYDAKSVKADLARANGAFDRAVRQPAKAAEGAELVIVAVPLPEVEDVFTAIAPHLASGAIVTDTATLKGPVIRWAQEKLPPSVHFVGGHVVPSPAVTGMESWESLNEADEDLLRGALYCLVTAGRTTEAVVETCTDFAQTMGAHPLFIDPVEHDGLQAGVRELPPLLSVALLRATVDTPGWREMRKFAAYAFAAATEAGSDDAAAAAQAVFLNRENAVRRLNSLLTELVRLREILHREEDEMLEQIFVEAMEGRAQWLEARAQGKLWGKDARSGIEDMPSVGEEFSRMFFGNMTDRLKGLTDSDDKD
jgi:prephenate dehydrogenase